ncbi:MAG: hypothetical protein ACK4VW_05770 [Anaerolineales bacterium]
MHHCPFIVLLLIVFLAYACNMPASAIWGRYMTPTPGAGSALADPPLPPTLFSPSPGLAESTPTFSWVLFPSATASPTLSPSPSPTAFFTATPNLPPTANGPLYQYISQSGDWLPAVARRFGVSEQEVYALISLPQEGLIPPGTTLFIPARLGETSPSQGVLPDSEYVLSATSADFDVAAFLAKTPGALRTYREYINPSGWTDAAAIIQRVAQENSVNPRLLLALLEFQGKWVYGAPDPFHQEYPLGHPDSAHKGLFLQLLWAVSQMDMAYYGWREGRVIELTFPDGQKLRLDPRLNAGSVAIYSLFTQLYSRPSWEAALKGFSELYRQMFGEAEARAAQVEPLFPAGLTAPSLILPFEPNVIWVFTGGPHAAWERNGPLAAVDFAPSSAVSGCDPSNQWAVASASGLVVRSENGLVVLDLDGDGREETGWVLIYLHLAKKGRVPAGVFVNAGDRLGHPSCEGGIATGRHLHFSRKYNGEWILADGPFPLILSGWRVYQGEKPYLGKMVKGDQVVIADVYGSSSAAIWREEP